MIPIMEFFGLRLRRHRFPRARIVDLRQRDSLGHVEGVAAYCFKDDCLDNMEVNL